MFSDDIEISDSDDIKEELVFVKEADPWSVIACLRGVMEQHVLRYQHPWIQSGRGCDHLRWSDNTISEIRSALHAICTMDVPFEVSDTLYLMFYEWARLELTLYKVPQAVLLEMGKSVGEVCEAALLGIGRLAKIHINYPNARLGVAAAFVRMAARSPTIAALIARETHARGLGYLEYGMYPFSAGMCVVDCAHCGMTIRTNHRFCTFCGGAKH